MLSSAIARLWPDLSPAERASAVLASMSPRERAALYWMFEQCTAEAQAGVSIMFAPVVRVLFAADLDPEDAVRLARQLLLEWAVPDTETRRLG